MNRQNYNKKIIELLSELIEVYPDERFGQILFNFVLNYSTSESGQIHIDDPFYEEPNVTFNRINEKWEKLKDQRLSQTGTTKVKRSFWTK